MKKIKSLLVLALVVTGLSATLTGCFIEEPGGGGGYHHHYYH